MDFNRFNSSIKRVVDNDAYSVTWVDIDASPLPQTLTCRGDIAASTRGEHGFVRD